MGEQAPPRWHGLSGQTGTRGMECRNVRRSGRRGAAHANFEHHHHKLS